MRFERVCLNSFTEDTHGKFIEDADIDQLLELLNELEEDGGEVLKSFFHENILEEV